MLWNTEAIEWKPQFTKDSTDLFKKQVNWMILWTSLDQWTHYARKEESSFRRGYRTMMSWLR